MAHSNSVITDEELALRVQRGETQWYGYLVERYEAKIIRYARKFIFGQDDIEDLVQEVFIKAYTNIQSFDSKRSFSPWLYRIAHNEFLNAIRKKGREKVTFFESDTLFPHPIYEEEKSELEMTELKKALDTCLDKIDIKYREPMILYYYEEIDYQGIAEIMHIPASTVGIRLRRGKAALKKIFNAAHPHIQNDYE
jgi:RNA polymerase sigma-70 factor (ECF subfamily)